MESEIEIGKAYADIIAKFDSYTVADISKKNLKAAEKFIKEFYTGADYEYKKYSEASRLRSEYIDN